MFRRSIFLVLFMFISISVSAHDSPDNSEETPRVFSVHDTNQDGVLDQYEYERFLYLQERHHETSGKSRPRHAQHLQFDDVDADNNGQITEDELVNQLNKQLRQQKRIRAREGWW